MEVTVKEEEITARKTKLGNLQTGAIFKRLSNGHILRLVRARSESKDALAIDIETGDLEYVMQSTEVLPAVRVNIEVQFPS